MESPMAQGRALRAITIAVGAAAIALPVLVVANPPVIPPPVRIARPATRVVPQAEIPVVEPLALVDVAPDDARAFNATVPFSTDPNPAARPFRIGGDPASQQRATACLAAAVLYEAGDDAIGERAVAQVVLNRLRHPAFPKTVCGVVFEGSDRRTGCQFTFTCDGALTRRPSEAAWTRAERIAAAALAGSVYAPVGQSTHYHTDWVVPYWQSSLDKVAAVHTHLFFRWTGWWGTPPAFNRTPSTVEPAEPQLAAWSDAHRMGAAMAEAGDTLDAAATLIEPTPPAPIAGDVSSFLVTLPRGAAPETYPALAAHACGQRLYCKYSGWADAAKTPAALPLAPGDIASMTFSYLRDRSADYEKPLWNCQQIKRADPRQCMKVQTYMSWAPVAKAGDTPTAAAAAPKPSEQLSGVRRRGDAAAATATAAPVGDAPPATAAVRDAPASKPAAPPAR